MYIARAKSNLAALNVLFTVDIFVISSIKGIEY